MARRRRPARLPCPGLAAAGAPGCGEGAYGSASAGPRLRRAARTVAGGPQPGVEVRPAGRGGRRRTATAVGHRSRTTPVGGGAVRGTGRSARLRTSGRTGDRAHPPGLHLVHGAGRGPADVPGLAPHRPLGGGRAVPGADTLRPQPQRPLHGGRTALRTAGIRAGRTDGGAGGDLRQPGPHGRGRGHRGGGAARMRCGHAEGRRGADASGRPRRTVVVAGSVGRGGPAVGLAGTVRGPYAAADHRPRGVGRLGRGAARGVVPGGRAAAGRRVGTGPARRPRYGIARRARQTAGHTTRGRTGRLGRRVHRRARPLRGVPAAGRVRRSVGRSARAGGGGLPGDRPGRGQLPLELQRGDGPGGTLHGPHRGEPLRGTGRDAGRGGGCGPGGRGYWSEAFQRLVSTLRLRAAMLQELEAPA